MSVSYNLSGIGGPVLSSDCRLPGLEGLYIWSPPICSYLLLALALALESVVVLLAVAGGGAGVLVLAGVLAESGAVSGLLAGGGTVTLLLDFVGKDLIKSNISLGLIPILFSFIISIKLFKFFALFTCSIIPVIVILSPPLFLIAFTAISFILTSMRPVKSGYVKANATSAFNAIGIAAKNQTPPVRSALLLSRFLIDFFIKRFTSMPCEINSSLNFKYLFLYFKYLLL